MTKIQVFLLSLIGAVPAGYLSYLLGMYLISQPSGASTMVMIISIITLICSATLTVTPFLVLSMYYSNYDPPKVSKPSKKKAKDVDELEDAEEVPASKSDSSGSVVEMDEVDAFAIDDDEISEDVAEVPLDDDDFAPLDDDEEERK